MKSYRLTQAAEDDLLEIGSSLFSAEWFWVANLAATFEVRTASSATYTHFQSRRDCALQPRVARNELPLEIVPRYANPRVAAAVCCTEQATTEPLQVIRVLHGVLDAAAQLQQ